MAGFGVNATFLSVLDHQNEFADVTTTAGANQFTHQFMASAAKPLEHEAEDIQPLVAEVIDVVVRKEALFSFGEGEGYGSKEHVEFIVKLKKGDSLKICSKRYSDLHQFHQTLSEQNLIDRSKAPVYPDKQVVREGWYKFDHTDTSSDFVRARKEALNTYLMKLFETNPLLYHEPYVIAFFGLEEFELAAALAISAAMGTPGGGATGAMPAPPVRKTQEQMYREVTQGTRRVEGVAFAGYNTTPAPYSRGGGGGGAYGAPLSAAPGSGRPPPAAAGASAHGLYDGAAPAPSPAALYDV